MITKRTQNEIEWIEKKHGITVSKFMREILDILNYVYSGLHHTGYYNQFKKNDFIATRSITYTEENRRSLATYDYNELTELVILAHYKEIRVGIYAEKDQLKILFSNRMGKRSKEDAVNQRHPTLKKAIQQINDYYEKSKAGSNNEK